MTSRFQLYRFGTFVAAMLVIYLASQIDRLKQWVPSDYASLVTVGFFAVLYKLLIFVYEKWLWRWIHPRFHFGGMWAYRLFNKITNQAQIGIFEVRQNGLELSIPRGHVWPFETPNPSVDEHGGRWASDFVYAAENQVSFVYTMVSRLPRTGSPSPRRCQGLINLYASTHDQLVGDFYDLDERAGHWGEVVAKRLSGFKRYSNRPAQARQVFPITQRDLDT